MNYRERVGQNINHYRKLYGLTLKELATRIGITEATMQKYEAGQIKRIDVEMVDNIARAIGVTANELTGWLDKDAEQEARLSRQKKHIQNAESIGITNSEMELILRRRKENAKTISNSGIEELDQVEKANEFISLYCDAPKEIRDAVVTLLKSAKQDRGFQGKNPNTTP